ncbi:MAG: hypothetical protein M1837_004120 [Sclerophora amabilis]|nr:MAG: hypothetical protein M1837_004120 [Sclerophora amabilis]
MRGVPGQLGRVSKRIVLSYIIDWIAILAIAAVGGGIDFIEPNKRPFDLSDAGISFPYVEDSKVSTAALILISLVASGVIIFLVCLFFVPGPTVDRSTSRSLIWRHKVWELNTAWSGLALSLAWTFLITNAFKNLFGRPRPDLLSRCNPDVENAEQYAIGVKNAEGSIVLVTWEICRGTAADLSDGFRSFPSGHCSFSFAGLTYLTLFLCSKFAIAVPFPTLRPRGIHPGSDDVRKANSPANLNVASSSGPNYEEDCFSPKSDGTFSSAPPGNEVSVFFRLRNHAAAPPIYLLIIAFVPIGVAAYISSTRYSDFRHHPFDIIFGSSLGAVIAWAAFRWYHLPIRKGAGWAWGARSRDRAFGIGLGVGNYVGREGWESASAASSSSSAPNGRTPVDLENGEGRAGVAPAAAGGRGVVLGPGHDDVAERGAYGSAMQPAMAR